MVTSNSSGKKFCSRNSPWLELDSGQTRWENFASQDREEIVRHYGPKIKIMALRLKAKLPQTVELGELMSAGSLGLMEALQKFNPELRIKFETYAESRIKGAMLDELRRMDWYSRGLRQRLRLMEHTVREIEQETGRPATVQEIAKRTGLSEKDVDMGLEMLQNQLCLSLDAISECVASVSDGGVDGDPYQSAAFQELIDKITLLIDELTPREKLVLSLYYGEELNMRETANVMEITEGRVSQLHSQALGKLRKLFKDQYNLDAY
ncbi:RNA polymerase, sigma 28 subunit, SigD/FliA/WhiG [Desulfocurvibacter africanus PCS]|uniref:RNA polymerase sigma factor n=1 Tax=Desulfocurvibacter africanus PCS TaxID=1262666 RepID=M5Q1S9_DESAF|nr:FliA/WhiG family RNA polymerase sigma factor [Desulfocurvibacter africanus]EMG37841.1 RNA polymerase, sigma 28 subunit, SigD/FliA/WhiG [Desulfocurvibacter africanus PCS]